MQKEMIGFKELCFQSVNCISMELTRFLLICISNVKQAKLILSLRQS